MNNYSFHLLWSVEDEAYIATCPEFPGLSAFGETPEQAISEGRRALKLMIETYKESGLALPEPKLAHEHSGQFRIRIPKSLHRQAAELAEKEGVSLNQFVTTCIAMGVGAAEADNRIEHLIKVWLEKTAANQRVIGWDHIDYWPQPIQEERAANTPSCSSAPITVH
ncbi:MAG: type II toxin-antitoxin system HicB family antitoxin [Blastocatellia bacterium]